MKNKIATIGIIIATIVLAGVAIFTAVRLYQLRKVSVAPTAPESKPKAAEPISCTALTFNLTTLPPPGKPTVSTSCVGTTPTATITWTGTPDPIFGFWVDISETTNFVIFYNKKVATGLSTDTTGFLGAVPSNLNQPLVLSIGKTYYARVFNGTWSPVSEGFTVNSCATSSPTATPTPTSPPGEPNSCGGTCGSNYNCQSGLFCYQGFCRNPDCPSQTSCSCPGTSTPTPTSAAAAATPTSISIAQASPTAEPSLPVAGTSFPTIIGVGIGILLLIGSLLLAL